MKYRGVGETFRDAMNRIATAMVDKGSSRHYHHFRDILMTQRFSPAGRIQAAVGSSRDTTPFNCFVSGTIPDSFVDCNNEHGSSIMGRVTEAAATMRMGGGIGYDFSTLRPRGTLIKKLQSNSSGPLSFMHVFDAVCGATSSAGHRRGAQMGVLRVDHPDIMEFVNAKHDNKNLSGFNMSVAITDDFMNAVARDAKFDLEFKGEIYKTVMAAELWESIMQSAWDWAEPGVLFIDTINRMNNLWYCETIAATNPCGEQTLPPFGACLLGSFNLTQYLVPIGQDMQNRQDWAFDFDQFIEDIPHVVRAMDNVIDRAKFPLVQQEEEAKSKRRMGLGVMGLANALETMGMPYGESVFLLMEDRILTTLRDTAYRASVEIAKEKGSFPLFDADLYCGGEFIRTLPEDIQHNIRKFGIRNSHLLSIAPTGTISMCNDNLSSSAEPVFEEWTERAVNTPDGPVIVRLQDYAAATFGTKSKFTHQVTATEHVDVLGVASRLVDSSVSKTCNVDGTMAWDDFKNIYSRAHELGAKGCTVFNSDGKRMALLKKSTSNENAACTFDPNTGNRSCE
jgi:ribonucleoside-diphosphate reductase alpha chain